MRRVQQRSNPVRRVAMSPQRYCELREAGPTILAIEHQAIAEMRPMRKPIALFVRLACMLIGAEYIERRQRASTTDASAA